MISAIVPVYRESQQQLITVIEQLTKTAHISQIIIAATKLDPEFESIQSLLDRDYPSVDLSISPQSGRARQMNAAAKLANHEFLLFLHCDTQLPKQAGRLIVESLQNNRWGRFNVQLDDRHWCYRVIAWFMNHRSRLTSICTGDQAMFMQQSFYRQLPGFPEQALMEDVEFCKRAKRLAKPVALTAKVTTSARRWQQGGVVRTVLLMWWLRLAYWFGVDPKTLASWYRNSR